MRANVFRIVVLSPSLFAACSTPAATSADLAVPNADLAARIDSPSADMTARAADLMTPAALDLALPPATTYARPPAVFGPNQFNLSPGQWVLTQNGQYSLNFQTDGNVVLYNIDHPLWATNTVGSGAAHLIFGSDGNLVLYAANGAPLWATNTAGHPTGSLNFQEDGNLVIYDPPAPIWASNTSSGGNAIPTASLVAGVSTWTRIFPTLFPTEDVVVADYDVVADYGADMTGAKDATAAIQGALQACSTNGGGTVFLPAGTYLVTSTITLPPFCTLRGDWAYATGDPGACSSPTCHGTLIEAAVSPGAAGPSVFSIGGSASLIGVTIHYPHQSLANVQSYGYTIVVPSGGANYMSSGILNVTLLNSYNGIAVSPNPTVAHEEATVQNVNGTVLHNGLYATNSADVDVYENIHFGPTYWVNAGTAFGAPAAADLAAYTRANATAFTLGDLEWSQFLNISADSFNYGMQTFLGARIHFIAELVGTQLTNCNVALQVNDVDTRFTQGAVFVGGQLQGSVAAARNASGGLVTLNNCSTIGPVSGNVVQKTSPESGPAGSVPPNYTEPNPTSVPRASGSQLLNVAAPPYGIVRVLPNASGVIPAFDVDATAGIQRALDDAGKAGGGTVYLPSGWYYVGGNLSIPAGVELRGSTTGPRRDQSGLSGGSVLFTTAGRNAPGATALLTLSGHLSGVANLQIFYPSNNPVSPLQPYPPAIRGVGTANYVRFVGISNGASGVDFTQSAQHWIERLVGCTSTNLIAVSSGGTVKSILDNLNAAFRNGFGMQRWGSEAMLNTLLAQTRANLKLVQITQGAGMEELTNVFAYGAADGVINASSSVALYNIATDNLGAGGYTVRATSPIVVLNALRYNGIDTTYGEPPSGNILLFNNSVIQ